MATKKQASSGDAADAFAAHNTATDLDGNTSGPTVDPTQQCQCKDCKAFRSSPSTPAA